jgi:hypothetical protein
MDESVTNEPPPRQIFQHSAATVQDAVTEKPPPLTAAVLDTFAIDTYLLQTFVAPRLIALCTLLLGTNPDEKWVRVLRMAALPLIQTATVLVTSGQTPAVQCLGLEFVPNRAPLTSNRHHHLGPHGATKTSTKSRLLAYAFLRFVVPALYKAFQNWVAARRHKLAAMMLHDTYEDSNEELLVQQQRRRQLIALQRQCNVAATIMAVMDRFVPVLQLAALLSCWSGVSHTPDPAMLLTGMTYQNIVTSSAASPPNASSQLQSGSQQQQQQQPLHVTFAHRRWLYEQGLETAKLLFSGCLMGSTVWTPVVRDTLVDPATIVLRRIWQRVSGRKTATETNAVCPICRRVPPTSAVRADCGHVYCYACLYLQQQQLQQQSAPWRPLNPVYKCKICGMKIGKAVAHYVNSNNTAKAKSAIDTKKSKFL